jgi:hypothetical protein
MNKASVRRFRSADVPFLVSRAHEEKDTGSNSVVHLAANGISS